MAKQTCPNGHIYDPNIYGNQCPLCPAATSTAGSPHPPTQIGTAASMPPQPPMGGAPQAGGMHTHIGTAPTPPVMPIASAMPMNDTSGATMLRPQGTEPAPNGSRTVIRRAPGQPTSGQAAVSRKLVGFLVTYNRDANGKAYNIYEGRNFIGRDSSCDISIPDDDQMSGRHLSILYRNVDDKFKLRDEQSSNGTFVNKELMDAGELQNYDIIRAGSTLFIFMAIPRI